MSKIIKGGAIAHDEWQLFRLEENENPTEVGLPEGNVIFPLAVWKARKDEIIASKKRIGVWLDAGEGPEQLAGDLDYCLVIAVNFAKFTDGRGFSTARLLRERYAYEGELRAIGEVLHDQLFFMKRCGFDAFVLKAGKSAEAALAGLQAFPEVYQGGVDQPLPAFRRRL